MGTPYKDIYEKFYECITDYDLADVGEVCRERMMLDYLRNACMSMRRWTGVDLSRNDDSRMFDAVQDEEVQYILAKGMCYFWIKPRVLNTDNLHNVMNTKDFTSFSPAELLLRLNETKKSLYKDFRNAAIEYSYLGGGQ